MPDTLAHTITVIRAELERSRAPRVYPDLHETTTFERDLQCSTIDMVCICIEIEDAFGITLPIEVEHCDTIGALADLVAAQLKEKALHA